MRPFTDQEYETMIAELTDTTSSSFDMLCAIAQKTLKTKITHWCVADSRLRGRGMEEDIMNDVLIRLIKTTLTHFLIRKDRNGEVNRNPDEFRKWMLTVAWNIKCDAADDLGKQKEQTRGFAEGEEERIPDPSYCDDALTYQRERVAAAFTIVLDSDVCVYKILTWLAQSLFIIEYDITKKQSNDVIISEFSEKTLFEMRDILFGCAEKIEWITITLEQRDRIERALNAESRGKRIGEFQYKEIFMKKGGKASISDWVNRMNGLIERQMKR